MGLLRLFSLKQKKVKGKLCPPRISVIGLMIKPITEVLGDKNKEGGGTKFTFYLFVLSDNKRIKR